MKRFSFTKTLGLAVVTLVLASSVDQAQAGGFSFGGKSGGGISLSFGGGHNNKHSNSHNNKHNNSHNNNHHVYKNLHNKHHHSYLRPYCPPPVVAVVRTPVPDGSTLTIHGKWFRSRGHAWMMIADRRFPIRILESTPGALTMQLPYMGVAQPTAARFFLVLPNGLIVEKNYILLTPQAPVPAPVQVHP